MMKYLFLIFLLFGSEALGHQPKLINYSPSLETPHLVTEPEISKAYYGQLKGSPHYYLIKSQKEFLFYTGILSPKVNDKYKWLSIDVICGTWSLA